MAVAADHSAAADAVHLGEGENLVVAYVVQDVVGVGLASESHRWVSARLMPPQEALGDGFPPILCNRA